MKDDLKSLLAFCCALAASAVPAVAAAQAADKPSAKSAEPLGRLFYTPAQRASLDVARTRRTRTTVGTDGDEETAAPAAQSITYGGMVRRSDGKSTVWINGRPVYDNDPAGGTTVVGRVRPDGGVSLLVPQSGRSIDLKPGQSVELLSGAIEEGFSRKPVAPESKPAAKSEAGTKPAAKSSVTERGIGEREPASRASRGSAGAKGETESETPRGPTR